MRPFRQGSDAQFLAWVATRLVEKHGDSPNVDYVSKLVSIALEMNPDKLTPNTHAYTELFQ